MRYRRSLAVAAYVGVGLIWVFGVLDRQLFFGSDAGAWIEFTFLILLHVAVGFAVGRWWVPALPLVWVALAYPLGYPSANLGEPVVIWQLLLNWTPAAAGLLGLGAALSTLGPWRGGLEVT